MKVKPWDHLWHVVPFVLLIQEYLVVQRVEVGVCLVQVEYELLLALPFVHHLLICHEKNDGDFFLEITAVHDESVPLDLETQLLFNAVME